MKISFAAFLLAMLALQGLISLPLLRTLQERTRRERLTGLIALAGLAAPPFLLVSILIGGIASLWFWQWNSPTGVISLASLALIVLAAINALVMLFQRTPKPTHSPE